MDRRAAQHDKSKLKADEFAGYQRFDDMPEGLEYGSDEYKAAMAKVMKGNNCWDLHCKRNDHHPEHYSKASDMSLLPLIEMVCDWRGAHDAYGNKGNWMDSIEVNLKEYEFVKWQIMVIWEVAKLLED